MYQSAVRQITEPSGLVEYQGSQHQNEKQRGINIK